MNTLFEIEETKSPRLLWIEKHGVKTHYAPHCADDPWMAVILNEDHVKRGLTIGEAMAEECVLYDENKQIGYGMTEDTAIIDMAKNIGIPLWNEESFTQPPSPPVE